ncbi:hypothetical protein C6I20_02830 [Aeromicrobium sp. A1-2]|uniref:hypothetical protein n=1 Tax=Aeromicrobium sp. A1-2 TaxID=2107713 RepID=UPI000E4917C4|nr:hypothetical protein [Aeromicrobium sp. A1-2]AXT84230.1 hypothetical protein C6I20_02830 [Aeromicrobium sp. A1-2]
MITSTDDERSRIADGLKRIDSTISYVTIEGGVDFNLDEVHGFAREREGKFRSSFFIVHDPDPTEASEWVADNVGYAFGAVGRDGGAFGELQYVDEGGAGLIRFLIELPYSESQDVWTKQSETVRALHTKWMNRHHNGDELIGTVGRAGIALPPLGKWSLNEVQTYGAWSWGTRFVPPQDLYMFYVEPIARQLIEHGPFFAMAHAGHGLNSYGLNLVTASPSGAVAAYVQHGFGGVYSNPVKDLIDINATYSRLHELMRAADETPVDGVRLLLVYSQFRGDCAIVDLDAIRRGADISGASTFGSEPELFGAMAELLELDNFDFGVGGNIAW